MRGVALMIRWRPLLGGAAEGLKNTEESFQRTPKCTHSLQMHATPVVHFKQQQQQQLLWYACWKRHPSLHCPSPPLASALSRAPEDQHGACSFPQALLLHHLLLPCRASA